MRNHECRLIAAYRFRRGSHWTFDANSFVEAVLSLYGNAEEIGWPTFDHGAGDPVENGITVQPRHKVSDR